MTVAAIAGGAAMWATIGAAVADAAVIAGTALSISASYKQADASADAARAQAKAQAEMYAQQSAEYERLADVENEKAGIAQVQGELEAETRSRALASEVGGIYAAYAGNGLLVDADDPNDTFANVLKSSVGEAQYDIATINDNTAISVWDHQQNRRAYLANASIYSNAAVNTLNVGEAQAASAYAGLTENAIGKGLSAVGTLAGMGMSSYGTLAKTGAASTAGAYDWSGSTWSATMA